MAAEPNRYKFALAFAPVTLGLAFLRVYGSRFLPRHLVTPITAFLFFSLFLLFYRSRRLNPHPPPLRTQRLLWSLPLLVLLLGLGEWLKMKSPQSLPWLTLLMMAGGLTWYFLRDRIASK